MHKDKGGTAIIISADEIKKTLPGYNPKASHLVHRESARIADSNFSSILRKEMCKNIILMSGGSASGKTEYVDTFLLDEDVIIFDGTLPTLLGASIKIKKVHSVDKIVSIHAVIPDDLRRSYVAFLGRERQYEDMHFFRTHASSRKTLLDIAVQYPQIEIILIESSYKKDRLQFEQFLFSKRQNLIEFLKNIQYTEREIKDFVV